MKTFFSKNPECENFSIIRPVGAAPLKAGDRHTDMTLRMAIRNSLAEDA